MTNTPATEEKYSLDDLCANVRTHVPDFDMASEIIMRLKFPAKALDASETVDLDALIVMLHEEINKKNGCNPYVKAGDISQIVRHLHATGRLKGAGE